MPESKHRKNRSRPRSDKQLSAATHGSPEPEDSPEVNGNERIIDITELTFRQHSVMPILAVSRSIAQAARDSGVAESTLRRWLLEPGFRDELDRLRQESWDLARQQAQAVLPACVAAVAEMALESEDRALRLRAARFLINYADRAGESDRLHADIQDLREALVLANTTIPPV